MSRHLHPPTVVTRVVFALLLGATAVACDANKGEPSPTAADPAPSEAQPTPNEEAAGETGEAQASAPDLSTAEGKVAFAAKVAGAIANDPANADEILEQNGLDREKLDELMYEIATNPEMRENYALAFADARATSTG